MLRQTPGAIGRPRFLSTPVQTMLPAGIRFGGTSASTTRAGELGLPLMVVIIKVQSALCRLLIERCLSAGRAPDNLRLVVHTIGFLADTVADAQVTILQADREAFSEVGRERGRPPPARPAVRRTIQSLRRRHARSPKSSEPVAHSRSAG